MRGNNKILNVQIEMEHLINQFNTRTTHGGSARLAKET